MINLIMINFILNDFKTYMFIIIFAFDIITFIGIKNVHFIINLINQFIFLILIFYLNHLIFIFFYYPLLLLFIIIH